jgi:uncharacterized protein (DUF1697 family)
MPRYVAFLRAINVGGHTVKMGQLRELFVGLGFTDVETFIASGNVIFTSPARKAATLEQKIEKLLEEKLGYAVRTFIRSTAELAAVANHQPFDAEELTNPANGLYIAFLSQVPSEEASRKVMLCRTPTDDFHMFGRELYWLCRTMMSDSRFSGARLEQTLGMAATFRNATTVRKLATKYS